MKELSIKEKAKRYDEAIIRGSRLWESDMITRENYEYIFQELKESEDEEIRMELLKAFQESEDSLYMVLTPHKRESFIAWLEKQGEKELDPRYSILDKLIEADTIYQMAMNDAMVQEAKTKAIDALSKLEIGKLLEIEKQGEQKPADKVETKFKVGDFIANDYCFGKVMALTDDAYLLDTGQGIPFSCEHNAHLWTIQDAKAGDVLYCKSGRIEYIVMNKGVNEHGNVDSYFRYNSLDGFGIDIPSVLSTRQDDITPATKEQRDLLFQKMKESGYEWDAEKKELKKIKQKPADLPKGEDYGIDGLYAAIDILQKTLGEVDGYQSDDGILTHKCAISAVKELSKQKPAWSEEDEAKINRIVSCLENLNVADNDILLKDVDWLKSLKDRVQPYPKQVLDFLDKLRTSKDRVQPKQEWNEEDEAVYSKIGCDTPEFYQEVLKRFNKERKEK